eukprot:6190514-Amphidinium_carterae.1
MTSLQPRRVCWKPFKFAHPARKMSCQHAHYPCRWLRNSQEKITVDRCAFASLAAILERPLPSVATRDVG